VLLELYGTDLESPILSFPKLKYPRSMNDNDGPLVARTIYEELFKNPTASLKPEIVPYALDLAVQKLQQNGVHPSRWATYIHVGI